MAAKEKKQQAKSVSAELARVYEATLESRAVGGHPFYETDNPQRKSRKAS
jgi:hypothetical protein